jgi:5-methylcytosine-specific restriction endonuclease McrA
MTMMLNDGRIAMDSLKALSDKELLNRTSKLVNQEQKLTFEILLHLIEVENRKIYRPLGYSSMFVYCTDGLGYSESSANRRIYAARAIRKCPRAYADLCKGRVNLGTLALVWRHLTPDLLDEIRGESYRRVLAIVSRFTPMIKHRDMTRPVAVIKPVAATGERQTAGATLESSSGLSVEAEPVNDPKLGQISLRRGGKKLTTGRQTEAVKMHQISCLVDDAVMQKLDRCKELLSGKHPCGIDYNTLILELASDWLEQHDPVRRSKRRKKRKKGKNSRRTSKAKKTDSKNPSRYISPATRDAIYARDGGQCTFVGSNGKRCQSRWDLEIHHDETPFAMGGGHSPGNLRLLCAVHNKLESERVYGRRHMKKHFKQKE